MPPQPLAAPELPREITEIARLLDAEGDRACLVGEGVEQLARGRRPERWSLGTSAQTDTIARIFSTAVPTARAGQSFQVPTTAGPVDILPSPGVPLDEQLRRRGLRRHAMAWSPALGTWIDPFEGARDLREQRIRTIGAASACLRRSPKTALVALRIHAETGDTLAPELIEALGGLGAEDMARVPTPERRRELLALLMGRQASSAVGLLMRSGLERALGVRAREDTPRLLERAAEDPVLRLGIWLRGSRAGRFARIQRLPRPLGQSVLRLISEHPADRTYNPRRKASLVRLARLSETERERLFWLLDAERQVAGAPGDSSVAALREALDRHLAAEAAAAAKPALALDGRSVMERLGVGPGPWIGEALQFLGERVEEDPSCNDTERLAELLSIWWKARPSPERDVAP